MIVSVNVFGPTILVRCRRPFSDALSVRFFCTRYFALRTFQAVSSLSDMLHILPARWSNLMSLYRVTLHTHVWSKRKLGYCFFMTIAQYLLILDIFTGVLSS